MINFSLIQESLPALLSGALVSLQIAAYAGLLGIIGGTLLGLAHTSKNVLIRFAVGTYVTIIRGTPMLIQITFAFYVLPQLGLAIPAFWAATIAIGLNSAAYMSQIVRSGIAAVGTGQLEAAHVLGLSRMQATRYIVLPQAFRILLPALGNEFITLIKDSSLASIIGVVELTKEGSIIRSRTFDALSVYAIVALFYLVMTTTLSIIVNRIEKRMKCHAKN